MNKGEFIKAISEKANISEKDTKAIFESMNTVICETLAKGEKIAIAGFGNYEVKHRNARQGRNPQTGATVEIPAKNVPVFKPSTNMKNAVL